MDSGLTPTDRASRGPLTCPGMTGAKLARGPAGGAGPLIFRYQPACKPGSVGHRLLAQEMRDGHSSGTTFARCLEQPTRTASLTSPCGVFAFQRTNPRCRPYSVLLPVWFAMPPPLPEARCALTAPFHPYRAEARRAKAGGSFSVALSLGPLPACAKKKPRRMLSGTACRWSPDFPPPQPFGPSGSGRPAD
ncbi:MAG: hypothetical protein QOF63_3975 [Thermoanaerobaculia bacterium]|nr:hypothetical protein [Thermoanaerobaculia bacterium]